MAQQLPKEDNNVKPFLCLFPERESPSGQNHVKSKFRGRGQSPSRWWEKQIKCEASSRVTMTLGDATCHPVPESGNLARFSPFAEHGPPSGIYCLQHAWKKKTKKGRKASV